VSMGAKQLPRSRFPRTHAPTLPPSPVVPPPVVPALECGTRAHTTCACAERFLRRERHKRTHFFVVVVCRHVASRTVALLSSEARKDHRTPRVVRVRCLRRARVLVVLEREREVCCPRRCLRATASSLLTSTNTGECWSLACPASPRRTQHMHSPHVVEQGSDPTSQRHRFKTQPRLHARPGPALATRGRAHARPRVTCQFS